MYFEDYVIGTEYPLEEINFVAEEMIEFAEKYDQRPFHLSAEGAKGTIFKGLAASGLHTLVSCWGRWTNSKIDQEGLICGIEIVWNKWLKPVYAGDTLVPKVIIKEKIPTSSRERGIVKFNLLAYNQDGELAMDSAINIFIKKRKN